MGQRHRLGEMKAAWSMGQWEVGNRSFWVQHALCLPGVGQGVGGVQSVSALESFSSSPLSALRFMVRSG